MRILFIWGFFCDINFIFSNKRQKNKQTKERPYLTLIGQFLPHSFTFLSNTFLPMTKLQQYKRKVESN